MRLSEASRLETAYALYVGIDWGTVTHQVAVLDAQRVPLGERAIAHEAVALQALTEWLTQLAGGEPARVAVALEVPRGAVVDTLLERGFHVFALNPKQLDRFHDRYTVAGAKDDRRDAFVLATALATDRPAFRALAPEDPLIIELREWSRVEDELRVEWGRLASRLREQLHRFYPQALALCPAADEGWFWALLGLAPRPAAARRLRRAAVVTLLRGHRIHRLTADHVLAALQSPPLRVAPGTVKAASAHVALLLPRLELVARQRRQVPPHVESIIGREHTLIKDLERRFEQGWPGTLQQHRPLLWEVCQLAPTVREGKLDDLCCHGLPCRGAEEARQTNPAETWVVGQFHRQD